MRRIIFLVILFVFLLAAFSIYFYLYRIKEEDVNQETRARLARIELQEASIPLPSQPLKTPEIIIPTRYNFLVPSESIFVEGNEIATAANVKAQACEGKASRFFNYAYKELEEEAADEGQMALKQTIVGAQLDGARRLFAKAKEESTDAEWAIMSPRLSRWLAAALNKIELDWKDRYRWVEGMLDSFREDL